MAQSPTPTGAQHWSAEQFRARGHAMVDLIADYWSSLDGPGAPPVLSRSEPGALLAALPERPPEHAEPWDAVLADVHRLIMPGITHWQSPEFFAFFPANASPPAVLGELFSAGLGVQGMLWATSPACTELEVRVTDWLAGMIGLPGSFTSTGAGDVVGDGGSGGGGGVIQGTASEAVLVALVAARDRARRESPGDQRPMVAYASTQAHSSVVKAAMIAGIAAGSEPREGFIAGPAPAGAPTGGVRLIGTDEHYAIDAGELERAIAADLAAGRRPVFVCASSGTTSSGAFDDLRAIGALAQRHGLWLHVDGAWAGSAWVCPELRGPMAGVERADSVCFNPHKWLLTNFDCSALFVRDRRALTDALSITPEYLRNRASSSGRVTDYRDWQVPLGRRFRALKLWFVIRQYGVEGLRAHIREHVRLAELFEGLVRADERFEVPVPRSLSLVCFRLRGRDDAAQRALMDRLNASGRLYLTHTVLPATKGRSAPTFTLRLAIGATRTQERHVRAAWEAIRAAADA
jgi:aromatic-L-amino-acid decarboxylase